MRTLTAFLNDTRIGTLSEGDDLWSFEYDAKWAAAPDSFDLSPNIQRAQLVHHDGGSNRPVQWYFDNLLPEENLREALKYDPKLALAHYHLGRVLESEGRDESAIDEYKSAAALDEKLAEPLYSLGRLYRRQDRTAEAESALAEYKRRKALSIDTL